MFPDIRFDMLAGIKWFDTYTLTFYVTPYLESYLPNMCVYIYIYIFRHIIYVAIHSDILSGIFSGILSDIYSVAYPSGMLHAPGSKDLLSTYLEDLTPVWGEKMKKKKNVKSERKIHYLVAHPTNRKWVSSPQL